MKRKRRRKPPTFKYRSKSKSQAHCGSISTIHNQTKTWFLAANHNPVCRIQIHTQSKHQQQTTKVQSQNIKININLNKSENLQQNKDSNNLKQLKHSNKLTWFFKPKPNQRMSWFYRLHRRHKGLIISEQNFEFEYANKNQY